MEFSLKYSVWIIFLLTIEANVIPNNYTITIWSNVDYQIFSGISEISITPTIATRSIQINCGQNLKIKKEESKIINATNKIRLTRFYFSAHTETLTLKTTRILEANKTYQLILGFSSSLEKTDAGFYRDYYVNDEGEEVWFAATQFEIKYARRAFPCFDSPVFKTPFTINIAHTKKYSAISNMPLIETISRGRVGWLMSSFETSPPMSTYMVAFFVSDFSYVNCASSNLKDKELRIWTRKNITYQAQFICPKIPEMVEYFHSVYKIEFPLAKLDVVAINEIRPNIFGSWGLIFYEEFKILTEEPTLLTSKHLVAHFAAQIANQWFGNLVLFDSSQYWWIIDGLGMFLGYKYVENATESKQNLLSRTYIKEKVLTPKGKPFMYDLASETKKKEVIIYYDEMVLTLSTYFFYMLNSMFGDQLFSDSIKNFLNRHKYRVVSQKDFWKSFNTSGTIWERQLKNVKFTTVLDSWFAPSVFPYILVTRNYKNSTIKIVQKNFVTNTSQNSCVWIPLKFTTGVERNFSEEIPTYWYNCKKPNQDLTILNLTNRTWVYSPRLQYSLFRINYDSRNWEMIFNDLWNNNEYPMPKEIRIELIETAIFFGAVGEVSLTVIHKVIVYVTQKDNGEILEAILPHLNRINHMLITRPKAKSPVFIMMIRNMIKRIADRIENQVESNDDERRTRIFVKNAARMFRVNDEAEAAQYLFRQWMRNPNDKNPIDVNIRESVYCVALEKGGDAEYNFLVKKINDTNLAEERMRIMKTLLCANKPQANF